MATHSCILAWKIPWTEKPGRETGLILRCAGKAGNPFQTTLSQGGVWSGVQADLG